MELALWEEAAQSARAWQRDAESAAEEGRAALALARAWRGAGDEQQAAAALEVAAAYLRALALDPTPEGASAAKVLREIESARQGVPAER